MFRIHHHFMIGGSVLLLLILPLMIIALKRHERSATPRLAIIQDMDKMPYLKPQRKSDFFADGRGMRPHIPGTLAREDFIYINQAETQLHPNNWAATHVVLNSKIKYEKMLYGQVLRNGQGDWVKAIPIHVTPEFVNRGQQKFDVYCGPCHGDNGRGNGLVNQYVTQLRAEGSADAGTWVQPTDLTSPAVKYMPDGQIYGVITNGIAAMAAYKDQIPVVDRWAIVAYVRALELAAAPVPASKLPAQDRPASPTGKVAKAGGIGTQVAAAAGQEQKQ